MRTSRRKDFTPEEWKSLGHEHRKALAEEYKTKEAEAPEIEDAPKEDDATDGKRRRRRKKKGGDAKEDDETDKRPKGPDEPPEDVAVSKSMTSKQTVVGAASSGCVSQDHVFPTHTIDENNNWVELEEFVQNINPATASVPILC